mgnify:CR=1 FL=1
MGDNDGVHLPLLNGENYSHWRLKMRRILDAKGLDDIVFGAIKTVVKAPSITGDALAITAPEVDERKSARAAMHLINALDEKNLSIVEACETARDIWSRLELEYANKEPTNLENLLTEFYTYQKKQKQSVSEYVAHIDKMALKLSQLGRTVDQESIKARITSGLTSDFKDFKRTWSMMPPQAKTMDVLLTNLKNEEQMNNESNPPAEALIARGPRPKRYVNQPRTSPAELKKSTQCSWCKQVSHWWKEYPRRPADQRLQDSELRRTTDSTVIDEVASKAISSVRTISPQSERFAPNSPRNFLMKIQLGSLIPEPRLI